MRVSRPAREKKRRRRVLVVTTCWPRPMRAVQRARLWAITPYRVRGQALDGQPSGVGGEAPRWEMVEAHAVLEVSNGVLDLGMAAMVGLQFQGISVAVGDEAVIAVAGEECQLGTGCGLHPADDEPHRERRRAHPGRGCRWSRPHRLHRPSSRGSPSSPFGYGLDQLPEAGVLADGDGEAHVQLAAD